MFNYRRRLLSLFFTIGITLSFIFGNVSISQALPWGELLFRGIQIMQISSLSDRQEVEYGRQIRQQLVSEGKIKIYQNPQLRSYVNQIGRRLVAVSDRSDIPYRFEVVDDDRVNAFATMGGFIYLNTGLLKIASNEAELASVIGHEIGHVVAKHSQEQMQQQAITQGLLSVAGLDSAQVVQLGVALALNLPHSRQDEYEADNLGLNMLRDAGYATQPMVDFMRKLGRSGGSVPTLLSTHPNSGERVMSLQQQVSSSTGYQGDGTDEQAYRFRIRRLLNRNQIQPSNRRSNRINNNRNTRNNRLNNNSYPSKGR